MKKFGLSYDIEYIESNKDWAFNCNMKAQYIRRKMLEYQDNIVWLDADAVVRQRPIYFDVMQEDVGVHYENTIGQRGTCRSGTMFFRNNETVLDFLDKWDMRCKRFPGEMDQVLLADTLLGYHIETHKVSLLPLPLSYYHIFDIMKNWGKPVIEHFQASRKMRTRR